MAEVIDYASVCAGIEAASVAWEELGFKPAWLAEVARFPSAVLAYRWPAIANLGDMTRLPPRVLTGAIRAPLIIVGGTPCQAFSLAGMRRGLRDPRGALTIKFVELIDATDHVRTASGEGECVALWENVHGVLSDEENAFGCFLAALVGESEPLEPAGGRWSNAGCVYGPKRAVAWRVLDAQYFGVAQRRCRVFVVASARKGFDPASVLFEREGLRRDHPPRRGTQQDIAATLTGGARQRGGYSTDDIPLTAFGGGNQSGAIEVATACRAHGTHDDFESETFIVHGASEVTGALLSNGKAAGSTTLQDAQSNLLVVHGTQDPDVSIDCAHTLGRNSGQENALCITGEVTHALKAEGYDASEDGSGRGQPIIAAFAENSQAQLRYEGGDGSITGPICCGGGKPGQGMPVAQVGATVRRLTPVECERLQGYEDNYTRIPLRLYKECKITRNRPAHRWEQVDGGWLLMASDGERYKAIGNSMAIPVMLWIGKRLQKALQ